MKEVIHVPYGPQMEGHSHTVTQNTAAPVEGGKERAQEGGCPGALTRQIPSYLLTQARLRGVSFVLTQRP